MNSKLLFAATVALALASVASSFAQAADNTAPRTRAEVKADVQRVIADGTLPRTEYGLSYGRSLDGRDAIGASTTTRAQVVAELQAAQRTAGYRAVLASDYNAYPAEQNRASTVTRAQVKAEVTDAIAAGTLPVSDYAGDRQFVTTHAKAPAPSRAPATLAQRLKAAFGRDAS